MMQRKIISTWLALGIVMIFVMVVIGGVTRLTHSGLSIVEWDLFSEAPLFPSDAEAEILFDKYKQFPEYKEINTYFTVDDFIDILFWENVHRKWGRVIGLVFILPYITFLLLGWVSKALNKRLIVILFLGAFQGFLGWFMVKSGLMDVPSVSHYRLSAHLITAFVTCAYIYWVLLWFRSNESVNPRAVFLPKLNTWVNITLCTLVLQIIFGGFVAGLKAGKAYNTFPKMGFDWFPADIINAGFIFTTVPGVQFVHRYMAYVVVILCFGIAFYSIKNKLTNYISTPVNLIVGITLLQFTLGVFTLLYSVPLSLGLLHQLGAFILLLAFINLKYRLKTS